MTKAIGVLEGYWEVFLKNYPSNNGSHLPHEYADGYEDGFLKALTILQEWRQDNELE